MHTDGGSVEAVQLQAPSDAHPLDHRVAPYNAPGAGYAPVSDLDAEHSHLSENPYSVPVGNPNALPNPFDDPQR